MLANIVRSHCRLRFENTCQSVLVFGIVGLARLRLALYNTLKPNTKLQKVEDKQTVQLFSPFESNTKQHI